VPKSCELLLGGFYFKPLISLSLCAIRPSTTNSAKQPQTHFHGDNTGSNPVGDAKQNQALRGDALPPVPSAGNAALTIDPELAPFSGIAGRAMPPGTGPSLASPASDNGCRSHDRERLMRPATRLRFGRGRPRENRLPRGGETAKWNILFFIMWGSQSGT